MVFNSPDLIGSAGVFLLLLAFLLNLLRKIPATGYPYILMNFAGAFLAAYASYLLRFWPFVILEGTWSLVSLVKLIRKNNSR
jgi:hypothetical protein